MSGIITSQPLPIQTIQSRLTDFLGGFPSFNELIRTRLYPRGDPPANSHRRPKLSLNGEKMLGLRHPVCPYCGRPLAKWGTKPCKMILEKGEVPDINGVQRYRCVVHGEITVNLSEFVPKFANYAENSSVGHVSYTSRGTSHPISS